MKGSFRVGAIAGIGIYIHFTFVLLMMFFVWADMSQGGTLLSALASLAFTLSIFGCVLLHELGHALAAKRYGIGTRDITLLPIGGLARLEKMPEEPRQEFIVAIAGPMVNVVIAAILIGALSLLNPLRDIWASLFPLRNFSGNMILDLAKLNLFLVAFNMLPAFPMDGGRVLRAFLATTMPYARATSVAASLGQMVAFGFALEGLGIINLMHPPGPNLILVLIAVFVWFGAAQEASAVQLKASLHGVPVSDVMIRDFRTLKPADTLDRAVEAILSGSQNDFPVAEDGGAVQGVLTRRDLMQALTKGGLNQHVDSVMHRDVLSCDTTDSLQMVLERFSAQELPMLPVVNHGRLVGLLTPENVGEYIMIQSALGKAPGRPGSGAKPQLPENQPSPPSDYMGSTGQNIVDTHR